MGLRKDAVRDTRLISPHCNPPPQTFRYPNIACELLTSDVSPINDKLGADESLLEKLYGFLEQEPPLNPLLASFFSKIFGNLIARKTEQVCMGRSMKTARGVLGKGSWLESLWSPSGGQSVFIAKYRELPVCLMILTVISTFAPKAFSHR